MVILKKIEKESKRNVHEVMKKISDKIWSSRDCQNCFHHDFFSDTFINNFKKAVAFCQI